MKSGPPQKAGPTITFGSLQRVQEGAACGAPPDTGKKQGTAQKKLTPEE